MRKRTDGWLSFWLITAVCGRKRSMIERTYGRITGPVSSTGTSPLFDASSKRYHHNRTGEDNADAHLKRQVMGREVVVAITDRKLHLGPWEHIFYYEFDGRRRKRVLVKIIGE